MGYYRPGGQDRPRIRESLHAGGDIHRRAEIILPIIEHDSQARPLVNADLQQQILTAAPISVAATIVEVAHRFAHAQCGSEGAVGGWEGCHHRIADRLHDSARLGGNNLIEDLEMGSDQVKGDQIADPLIELGRALEVGEQESQAGDFEPLFGINRVCAVEITKNLIG
jgi:hypothetical protein